MPITTSPRTPSAPRPRARPAPEPTASPPPATALGRILHSRPALTRWHRPLMVFAAVMAVAALGCAVGLVVDDRVVVGAAVWLKPLKFSVSFSVYALSLAWMLSLQTDRAGRSARWGRRAGTTVVVAASVEMAIILSAAVRGTRSHFNVETPPERALFILMGVTIVVLWVANLVIALLLLRERLDDPAAAWALRLGCLIGLIGLALGALMMAPDQGGSSGLDGVSGAHSVGVPDGGPGMPVTGWSTEGGDLRIPHFVGMHALQLLPLLAWALRAAAGRADRHTGRTAPYGLRLRQRLYDPLVRVRLVLIASGGYASVVALVTWQALRGQPLILPDAATATAWAATAAITALACTVALRTTQSTPPAPPIAASPTPAAPIPVEPADRKDSPPR